MSAEQIAKKLTPVQRNLLVKLKPIRGGQKITIANGAPGPLTVLGLEDRGLFVCRLDQDGWTVWLGDIGLEVRAILAAQGPRA